VRRRNRLGVCLACSTIDGRYCIRNAHGCVGDQSTDARGPCLTPTSNSMGNVQHAERGKEHAASQEGDMVENGAYLNWGRAGA